MDGRPIHELESQLGLDFERKDLLARAFVHRSYLNEVEEGTELSDNERLEFLGDSVLSLVVSEMLFERFPDRQEGDLTTLRAALVRRETLARFAEQLDLGEFLMLGHGEEESGGRTRPATLCATFEALIGAIYVEWGVDAVRAFALPMIQAELDKVQRQALEKDAKSRLQEWAQSTFGRTPRYRTVASDGPDHDKLFTIQVSLDKTPCGVGQGRSKQEAAQLSAAHALLRMGQDAPEYVPNPDLEDRWPLPDFAERDAA